jgi:hypothetical protein
MARKRFDDVEYRIVEDPARPRRRSPRRWALGGAAALIATAGAAAAASALSQHANDAPPSWHNSRHMHHGAAGLPPAGGQHAAMADAIRTSATSADVARAERFKRNLLYGRLLRHAAKAR